MSIMIDMPAAMVREASAYAESQGLTLSSLLRNYLCDVTNRTSRARLRGVAAKYADARKRALEKDAFKGAMRAKYA